MTYDTYMYVFYGGAGLALFFLLLSVVLFIVLKIPSVIGELSGSTAKKAIENIRKQNELGSAHSSEASISHGRSAGRKDKNSYRETTVIAKSHDSYSDAFLTTKIGTEQLASDAKKSYETTLLDNTAASETTVLNETEYNETTVLNETKYNDTTVLNEMEYRDTTVLQQSAAQSFSIEYEIILIHTNEII